VVGDANWEDNAKPSFPITDDKGNQYVPIQAVGSFDLNQVQMTFFRPNITNAPVTVTVALSATSVATGMRLVESDKINALDVYNGVYHLAVDSFNPETVSPGSVTTTAADDFVYEASVLPGDNLNVPFFSFTSWSGTKREEAGSSVTPIIQTMACATGAKATAGALDATVTMNLGKNLMLLVAMFKKSPGAAGLAARSAPRSLGRGLGR
jgi:hypothetical protein